jgi:hypothetical protein
MCLVLFSIREMRLVRANGSREHLQESMACCGLLQVSPQCKSGEIHMFHHFPIAKIHVPR